LFISNQDLILDTRSIKKNDCAFGTLLNAQKVSGVSENKHIASSFIKVWEEKKFKLSFVNLLNRSHKFK